MRLPGSASKCIRRAVGDFDQPLGAKHDHRVRQAVDRQLRGRLRPLKPRVIDLAIFPQTLGHQVERAGEFPDLAVE